MSIKKGVIILLLPIITALAVLGTFAGLSLINHSKVQAAMDMEYQQAQRIHELEAQHPAVKQATDLNLETVYQGTGIDAPAGADARNVVSLCFTVQLKSEGKGMYTATTANGSEITVYENSKRNFATLMLDVKQDQQEKAVADIATLVNFVNSSVKEPEASEVASKLYIAALGLEEGVEQEIALDQAGFVVTKHDGWLLFRIY